MIARENWRNSDSIMPLYPPWTSQEDTWNLTWASTVRSQCLTASTGTALLGYILQINIVFCGLGHVKYSMKVWDHMHHSVTSLISGKLLAPNTQTPCQLSAINIEYICSYHLQSKQTSCHYDKGPKTMSKSIATEVPTAVPMNNTIFWEVPPHCWSLLDYTAS